MMLEDASTTYNGACRDNIKLCRCKRTARHHKYEILHLKRLAIEQ